jgi:hypothetical protein
LRGEETLLTKIEVNQIQAAIFVSAIEMPDKLGLAKSLRDRIQRLNGEPLVLPLKHQEAPPEIPRVILKGEDEKFSLNVARSRFDLFFAPSDSDMDESFGDFVPILEEVLRACKEILSPSVKRLGLVSKASFMLDESSNLVIASNLLKEERFTNTYEVQINVLNRVSLGPVEVNRWLKIHSARNKSDQDDDRAIIIETDTNTMPERPLPYGDDQFLLFFNAAWKDAKKEIDRVKSSLQL